MTLVLDFFPLAAFLIAYKAQGIYAATAALMGAMVLLLAIDWVRLRRIPPLHAISAALVLVLGAFTLAFRNPLFLKWKPTLLLWLLALAFAASLWIGRTPLLQRLLGSALPAAEHMTRRVWRQATWLWCSFYTLLGAANLYVAYHASESTWVNFKVYGLSIAAVVFAVLQGLWLNARSEAATRD